MPEMLLPLKALAYIIFILYLLLQILMTAVQTLVRMVDYAEILDQTLSTVRVKKDSRATDATWVRSSFSLLFCEKWQSFIRIVSRV